MVLLGPWPLFPGYSSPWLWQHTVPHVGTVPVSTFESSPFRNMLVTQAGWKEDREGKELSQLPV